MNEVIEIILQSLTRLKESVKENELESDQLIPWSYCENFHLLNILANEVISCSDKTSARRLSCTSILITTTFVGFFNATRRGKRKP